MTTEVMMDLYLLVAEESTGPQDGNTMFAFNARYKLPTGVAVDGHGNIQFTDEAPKIVTIKYILKTRDLSWGPEKYAVTLMPSSTEGVEHMLWIANGKVKPKVKTNADGFSDYKADDASGQSSISVTMDRAQANSEVYSYSLAVNMKKANEPAITVRDDPQIRNPPRNEHPDWIGPASIGLLVGVAVVCMLAALRNRTKK